MLGWLSVWSEVQTCIWPSWRRCHSLPHASVKSRLVLRFWYQFTRIVPDKWPLNGCVCVYSWSSLMEIVLHGIEFCKLRRLINQSINLYLYQATNAHIAKPNICKKIKKANTTLLHYTKYYHTDRRKKGKLSRYWSVTFTSIFSNDLLKSWQSQFVQHHGYTLTTVLTRPKVTTEH